MCVFQPRRKNFQDRWNKVDPHTKQQLKGKREEREMRVAYIQRVSRLICFVSYMIYISSIFSISTFYTYLERFSFMLIYYYIYIFFLFFFILFSFFGFALCVKTKFPPLRVKNFWKGAYSFMAIMGIWRHPTVSISRFGFWLWLEIWTQDALLFVLPSITVGWLQARRRIFKRSTKEEMRPQKQWGKPLKKKKGNIDPPFFTLFAS